MFHVEHHADAPGELRKEDRMFHVEHGTLMGSGIRWACLHQVVTTLAAMSVVLAVANQKGGVGKTTTVVNVGAYAALAGQRTLIIDIDGQGTRDQRAGRRASRSFCVCRWSTSADTHSRPRYCGLFG